MESQDQPRQDFDMSFMEKVPKAFFSESIGPHVDLMTHQFSDEVFHGAMTSIASEARAILRDVEGAVVRYMLLFGDSIVSEFVSSGGVVHAKGGKASIEDLDRLSTALLGERVAFMLSTIDVAIPASNESDHVEVDPARFMAAIALADLYRASMCGNWSDYLTGLGGYYAIEAGREISIANALHGEEKDNASLVTRIELSKRSRLGADLRWANDPTQDAKPKMKAEWLKWMTTTKDRSRGEKSRFRREMLSRYPVSEGTLKNWMTMWTKELGA